MRAGSSQTRIESFGYEWKTNMQSYIANKLMWNPDQDLMRLQEEYLRGYYGTAAAPYV
ncbi:MAG: DUF4838 domain-containing protein, partial [Kiritimatiellae bacterium]|nr:DUF4838 domain-containing protein [Kiritimatiellia bacterium]